MGGAGDPPKASGSHCKLQFINFSLLFRPCYFSGRPPYRTKIIYQPQPFVNLPAQKNSPQSVTIYGYTLVVYRVYDNPHYEAAGAISGGASGRDVFRLNHQLRNNVA
jgi:hypothetical protein